MGIKKKKNNQDRAVISFYGKLKPPRGKFKTRARNMKKALQKNTKG
ncbi:hypothetical protein [Aquimarina brevivitae]|uniref:Uncharacterized protein n=1 Tax=Aquimarina brevivitae TaxID=323412 RepID=A0A4Q7PH25_9FLAO|nr:hypothetical protein [Aquimarina brevivitae]RZS99836.1 hypothetical protein EV197_1064 [Aquimarina brevivitae]